MDFDREKTKHTNASIFGQANVSFPIRTTLV